MLTTDFIAKYYEENKKGLLRLAKVRSQDKQGVMYEDIVQETFCRILKYKHLYDENKDFSKWVHSILYNVVRDITKQERLKGAFVEVREDDIFTSETFMLDGERLKDIEEKIERIKNTSHRNILYQALILHLPMEDIRQISEESPANIRKILSRFKQEIKEM